MGLGLAVCATACVGDPPVATLSAEQRAVLDQQVVAAPPAGMVPHAAQLGDSVALVGYSLRPGVLRAGQPATLVLVWRAIAPAPPGYSQFTHLVDAGGAMLANLDRAGRFRAMDGVLGTPFPPSRWSVGKLHLDELTFTVPRGAAGAVSVLAGLYRGRERLPASGPAEHRAGDAVRITLRVEPDAATAAIKELTVPQLLAGEAITLDGVLDEAAWAAAARTGPFVHPGHGRHVPQLPVQGSARLLWDARSMYVAFEVTDATVTGGWPEGAVDAHLWEKDTVEVMIDPDGDGDNADYYEIQINPQNLVFDTQYDRYNHPNGGGRGPFGHEAWSAKLTSAVKVHGSLDDHGDRDQGYVVEAAIPWSSFTLARHSPPRVGDAWRMNLYAMENNGGVAWSPLLGQGNFHRASRFGRVRWGPPRSSTPRR